MLGISEKNAARLQLKVAIPEDLQTFLYDTCPVRFLVFLSFIPSIPFPPSFLPFAPRMNWHVVLVLSPTLLLRFFADVMFMPGMIMAIAMTMQVFLSIWMHAFVSSDRTRRRVTNGGSQVVDE